MPTNNMNDCRYPKLSIIMPFFNKGNLVGEMIDSILANDFQDWELLAIDDGSSEETVQYLSKYATDERIKFIKRIEEPKGAQTCRNIGIREMRGEFVVFFDSDDYIFPYCLKTRVECLQQRPELDFMVFPNYTLLDNEFITKIKDTTFGYNVHKDDLAAFLKRELPFIVWSNIYRSESIRRNNLWWDTQLLSLQDCDFNVQAIISGLKYDYAYVKPDLGYRIRYSTNNISRKIHSEEHINSHLYASEKLFKIVQDKYGHRYDKYIYQGILLLYNKVFTDGIDKPIAERFVQTTRQYSQRYGRLLDMQVKFTNLLGKALPRKIARQIPMGLFLIKSQYRRTNTVNKITPKA